MHLENLSGLAFAVVVIFCLVVGSEIYYRRNKKHGEFSRKLIHISVGSFVATWPFFLSWGEIQLLSLALLVGISVSRYLQFFKAIHSVDRDTWGELFFAAAIGLIALLTHDKYIFAAAILQMSVADGLAAIIGTRFGKRSQYFVAGHAKSVIGSASFIVVSLVVLGGYGWLAGVTLDPFILVAISIGTAAIENLGVYGLDNLLVPLLVTLALRAY